MKRLSSVLILVIFLGYDTAAAVLLPSGKDSLNHQIGGGRGYAVPGTEITVWAFGLEETRTGEYAILFQSREPQWEKEFIAEARFTAMGVPRPYATWLDSCFRLDGTLCGRFEKVEMSSAYELRDFIIAKIQAREQSSFQRDEF